MSASPFRVERLPEAAASGRRGEAGAMERPRHRQPGETTMATRFTSIHVPSECREMIRSGALVSVSTSGGKDSQAMTILLSRIVPRDQLVAVHAPLEGVEWEGTIEHIRATLPDGVTLILAHVTSGKTLLDRVEERGMWPGIRQRWCTASHYGTLAIVRPMETESLC